MITRLALFNVDIIVYQTVLNTLEITDSVPNQICRRKNQKYRNFARVLYQLMCEKLFYLRSFAYSILQTLHVYNLCFLSVFWQSTQNWNCHTVDGALMTRPFSRKRSVFIRNYLSRLIHLFFTQTIFSVKDFYWF